MPDPRCPAVRALTAAATLFLCVSHASAPGGQAAGGPDAAATVLACQVAQSLPVPPAEAREGGFAFVFESLGGTAADGRACTAYRLRNLPGSPPTPVRWAAGSEGCLETLSWRQFALNRHGELGPEPTIHGARRQVGVVALRDG